ncbi:hypothetical protein EVAR_46335_1 [Eumeta japonica]|uniref:Peptidase A2 domain-containing protein n=1 Tax=Eumeta variegata TaxID=151549 RepID=A0A4C1WY16_EUMVA|nr:hypothetical protein EVAR_46335_1 [Eumeta japonica]
MVETRSTGCRDDTWRSDRRRAIEERRLYIVKASSTVKSKTSRRELARAEEECARALYEAAKARERLARAVKARIEADISSEEENEAASVTERSRERRQTTAVDSRDMRPELRVRSPPCPRKESPSRPAEYTTVLRDETGAEVCTSREQKNTEIEGIVTALKEIVKCLPRSQAQHQPSNSLHTVHEERKRSHKDIRDLPYFSGNHSDWLVFRTAYRQTAPYLEEIDNIVRLRKHIVGAAAEATKTLFINESSSQEIVDFLEQRYGAPDALVIAETNKLRALPKIGEEPHELYEFSAKVNGVVGTVKALDKTKQLNNPEIIHVAISKLPHALRLKWYSYYAQNTHDVPDIIKLADFLNTECKIQGKFETPGNLAPLPQGRREQRHRTHTVRTGRAAVVASSSSSTPAPARPGCSICKEAHLASSCPRLLKADVDERWNLAKKSRATTTLKAVVTSARHRSSSTLLKMIPVVIRGATATLSTFALLDEGSTVTLMEAAVAERVGATGPKEPFTIEGVAGARINANESRKISITIRGLHQKAEHPFIAHTVRDLHIAPQSIPDNIVEECEHLADIRSQITYASGTPTILLGQDNWHLIVTRGVRSGGLQQPAASFTELGCATARARVPPAESIYAARHKRTRKNEDEPSWKPSHKVTLECRGQPVAQNRRRLNDRYHRIRASRRTAADEAAQMDSFKKTSRG